MWHRIFEWKSWISWPEFYSNIVVLKLGGGCAGSGSRGAWCAGSGSREGWCAGRASRGRWCAGSGLTQIFCAKIMGFVGLVFSRIWPPMLPGLLWGPSDVSWAFLMTFCLIVSYMIINFSIEEEHSFRFCLLAARWFQHGLRVSRRLPGPPIHFLCNAKNKLLAFSTCHVCADSK